jgi:hypothetical protein
VKPSALFRSDRAGQHARTRALVIGRDIQVGGRASAHHMPADGRLAGGLASCFLAAPRPSETEWSWAPRSLALSTASSRSSNRSASSSLSRSTPSMSCVKSLDPIDTPVAQKMKPSKVGTPSREGFTSLYGLDRPDSDALMCEGLRTFPFSSSRFRESEAQDPMGHGCVQRPATAPLASELRARISIYALPRWPRQRGHWANRASLVHKHAQ